MEMIDKKTVALKLALEALAYHGELKRKQAMAAIREALAQERSSVEQPAQPQQEPVAWLWHHPTGGFRNQPLSQLSFDPGPSAFPGWGITPLYTSPPAQPQQ